MISFLRNMINGTSKYRQKLDARMNLVYTFHKLNLISSEELSHAKVNFIMAKHLEKTY